VSIPAVILWTLAFFGAGAVLLMLYFFWLCATSGAGEANPEEASHEDAEVGK
jgi:fatty acid desaturase